MPKFRKKCPTIAAEQYRAGVSTAGVCFCDILPLTVDGEAHVHTRGGTVRISSGDWVVKGAFDDFYVVADDVFRKTYDLEPEALCGFTDYDSYLRCMFGDGSVPMPMPANCGYPGDGE